MGAGVTASAASMPGGAAANLSESSCCFKPLLTKGIRHLLKVLRRCCGEAATAQDANQAYVTNNFTGILLTVPIAGHKEPYKATFHGPKLRSAIQDAYTALPQELQHMFEAQGCAFEHCGVACV